MAKVVETTSRLMDLLNFLVHRPGYSAARIAEEAGLEGADPAQFVYDALRRRHRIHIKLVDWILKEAYEGAPASRLPLLLKEAGLNERQRKVLVEMFDQMIEANQAAGDGPPASQNLDSSAGGSGGERPPKGDSARTSALREGSTSGARPESDAPPPELTAAALQARGGRPPNVIEARKSAQEKPPGPPEEADPKSADADRTKKATPPTGAGRSRRPKQDTKKKKK